MIEILRTYDFMDLVCISCINGLKSPSDYPNVFFCCIRFYYFHLPSSHPSLLSTWISGRVCLLSLLIFGFGFNTTLSPLSPFEPTKSLVVSEESIMLSIFNSIESILYPLNHSAIVSTPVENI